MDITRCFLLVLVIPGFNTDNTSTTQKLLKRPNSICDGIDKYKYCDGVINCLDGSDETREACDFVSISKCPSSTFQCAYGACISRKKHCDGHNDCSDGSDEVGCPITHSTLISNLYVHTDLNNSSTHERFKRQSNICSGIERYDICDGVKNCEDGSDETREACDFVSITTCPSTSFQCAYGACINPKKRCDRNIDCADRSDEMGCPFTSPVSNNNEYSGCGEGERQCQNRQCVDKYSFCDSIVDCADRSDETIATCRELYRGLGCRTGQWQCRYGACLRGAQRCDQKVDCWDGSDEANCPLTSGMTPSTPVYDPPSINRTDSTSTTSVVDPQGRQCQVPVNAENREFSTYNSGFKEIRPGTFIPHKGLLVVKCAQNHLFNPKLGIGTQSLTVCADGRWSEDIPKCLKLCPNLTSPTVERTCSSSQNCDKPMIPGTKVDFKCKAFYVSRNTGFYGNQRTWIICGENGEWSGPELECVPGCGKSNLLGFSQPTIAGGMIPQLGFFPWHAGLYLLQGSQWEVSCGGTLISLNVILTAAHCVTNSSRVDVTQFDKENMMIMLGKFYRDLTKEDSGQQQFNVKEVHVHPSYFGGPRQYVNDIALIVMDREADLSSYVMPACVDTENSFASQLDKRPGYVAGWGYIEECIANGQACGTFSETLMYTQMQVIKTQDCYRTTQLISLDSNSKVTEDKYCAGNGKASVVQQGDSGGGHTIAFNAQFYVFGIVSVKLIASAATGGSSPGYVYAGFTNVSFHMSWLRSTMETINTNLQSRNSFLHH